MEKVRQLTDRLPPSPNSLIMATNRHPDRPNRCRIHSPNKYQHPQHRQHGQSGAKVERCDGVDGLPQPAGYQAGRKQGNTHDPVIVSVFDAPYHWESGSAEVTHAIEFRFVFLHKKTQIFIKPLGWPFKLSFWTMIRLYLRKIIMNHRVSLRASFFVGQT